MKLEDVRIVRKEALEFLSKAGIVLTEEEKRNIEVADFGLNDLRNIGLEVVTYINNDIYCAKELVLFPGQTCPEHRHPPLSDTNPGKRETFRCRIGEVYLYVEGEPTEYIKATIPEKYKEYFTVRHEIVLKPGEQHTISSDTLHWFQAGSEGCVVSEFSSTSTDEEDIWTDPNLKRIPVIED